MESYNTNPKITSSVNQCAPRQKDWSTRDGRRPSNRPSSEEEQFFNEHLEYLAKKTTLNLEALCKTTFKCALFSNGEKTKEKDIIARIPPIAFTEMNGMPKQLSENITKLQFKYLSPIQVTMIPILQRGRDAVGCSETGSGKTITYLLPLIGNMLLNGYPMNPFLKPGENAPAFPIALVLVPTRELAEQVYKESKKLAYRTGIRAVKVYGGDGKGFQIKELRNGCDILIATPGRLIDLITCGFISLQMISVLILDEADRMLDMGFTEEINKIITGMNMPAKTQRQNIMLSATFSDSIREIARQYLNDYYFIEPKDQAPKKVKQELYQAEDLDKPKILINLLKNIKGSVLIFLDTKKGVDELTANLTAMKIKVEYIHGDRNQRERHQSISNFSSGVSSILIATDIASRGIDFPSVTCVINYDMPRNFDDYIHRIGRTGRMGQEGRAISFLNGRNKNIFPNLANYLRSQNQEIPSWLEGGRAFRGKENRRERSSSREYTSFGGKSFNERGDGEKKWYSRKEVKAKGENMRPKRERSRSRSTSNHRERFKANLGRERNQY